MAPTSRREIHPVLPWAWAGSVMVLVLARRASSSFVIDLAVISSALVLYASTRIPEHRRNTFRLGFLVASSAVVIRMLVALIIGVPMPGRVIFTLPSIDLPDFLVGIRLGGPVTTERLTSALSESMTFAAIILAISIAHAWTTPHRLLKALPYRFYGFGLATSIATSITPQTATSISRVNQALRLRGDESSGARRARRIIMPVLEESLERSIDLAASLDARGYGLGKKPTKYRPQRWQFAESLPIIGILLLIATLPTLQLSAPIEFALVLAVLMSVKFV